MQGKGIERCGSARALIVTHLGLFLPSAWPVLIDHPWDSYRWTWVRLWPILPGFLPGALVAPTWASSLACIW